MWWDLLEDWHYIIHVLTCWDKRAVAACAWVLIDWWPRFQLHFSLQTKMTSVTMTVCHLHQSSSIIVRLSEEYWRHVYMNTPADEFSMQSDIDGCHLKEAVWRIASDVWNKMIYVLLLPSVKRNVMKGSSCVLICWVPTFFEVVNGGMPVRVTSLSVGTWHKPAFHKWLCLCRTEHTAIPAHINWKLTRSRSGVDVVIVFTALDQNDIEFNVVHRSFVGGNWVC